MQPLGRALTTPAPTFGALRLTGDEQRLSFLYANTEEDNLIVLNGREVGRSVHGEFPHNYTPHLMNHTPQEPACLSSLHVTLRAAFNALLKRSDLSLAERRLLEGAVDLPALRVTAVSQKPKRIEGTLSLEHLA
jgi:hypothetical protein